MSEKTKKDVNIIKKQLTHERNLKLDAFQRVDELQTQVKDMIISRRKEIVYGEINCNWIFIYFIQEWCICTLQFSEKKVSFGALTCTTVDGFQSTVYLANK